MNSFMFMLMAGGTGDAPSIELVKTWAERVANTMQALQATVIGVGLVFLILGLLIGIIQLTHLFLKIAEKKKGGAAANADVEPIVGSDVIGQGEIAAVIAAAIMMCQAECQASDGEGATFIVRNIKRIR